MAWYVLENPSDVYNGDETEEEREEWLDEFTRWVASTFDGRVSRLNHPGLGEPIPDEVIGALLEYWHEKILWVR